MRVVGSCQVQTGVSPAFTDNRGFSSVERVKAGEYRLYFDTNYAPTEVNCSVTPYGELNGRVVRTLNGVAEDGRTWVKVTMVDDAGADADIDFTVNAVGLQ